MTTNQTTDWYRGYSHTRTEAEMIDAQNAYITALPAQYQTAGEAQARGCSDELSRYGKTELGRRCIYSSFYSTLDTWIGQLEYQANYDPNDPIEVQHRADVKAARAARTSPGQLWEPCPVCGIEPVRADSGYCETHHNERGNAPRTGVSGELYGGAE